MFMTDEIDAQLAQVERSHNERNVDVWRRMILSVRVLQQSRNVFKHFMVVKELLTASTLGTP
jgi:hypothetical protein